jgi:flagellar biosynthesis protein FlhB
MADAQDRNLPASARKINRARADGQVPRSRELGHLAAFAVAGGVVVAMAQPLAGAMTRVLNEGLHFNAATLAHPESMLEQLRTLALWMLAVALPLGLLAAVLGVASAVLSGGWNFTWKPLMPNLGKLNPLAGLGRMFSIAHLGDMLKSCLLALVLGTIGVLYLQAHWLQFHEAAGMAPAAAIGNLGALMLPGLALMLVAMAVFAVLDVPLQRFLFARRLKMSREEVKQEYKELEGNQEVKAKVKAKMREVSRRRMLAAVPRADLVVMNPTHYAVALKYDETGMGAPRVVAKGADLLALRIRDIAAEAKVPVLRMPPLARALYAHVELDHEIPAALFAAVAQVLAYVYQLRAAMAGQGPMPADPAQPAIPPELDPHHPKARPAAAMESDE